MASESGNCEVNIYYYWSIAGSRGKNSKESKKR
jgi:hypothetical protein